MAKRTIELQSWHIRVDAGLAARIDLSLLDPLTGKIRYGARVELIERLLREHLRKEELLNEHAQEEN